jgi:hypothetical protein
MKQGYIKTFLFIYFLGCFVLSRAQQTTGDSTRKVSIVPVNPDTLKKSNTAIPLVKTDSVKAPKRAEKLSAKFDSSEVIITEGEVFSENIRVVSNIDLPLSFKADVNFPEEWRSLVNPNKIFFIAPHDTIYIPIRLIPNEKIRGNTKYMINVFLFDTLGAPITSTHINAARPKFMKWTLTLGPNKKIYFKNDSNEAKFTINIGNEGTEPQDLYMSMVNIRKDIILLDTSGKIIKKPNYTFTLRQYTDTTFHFGVKLYSAGRNMKRIDSDGYGPGGYNDSKSYALFVKTTETNLFGTLARQVADKISFVKLPNVRKISEFGMFSLPVTMDLNFSDLFAQDLIVNLNLRGSTFLDNGASLVYSFQALGAFGINGGSVFPPPFFTIGYNDYHLSVTVGDVGGGGGGIGVGGKGINVQYKLNKRHRVGAFLVFNPGFLTQRLTYFGTGANYNYFGDRFSGGITYTHLQNISSTTFSVNSDYVSFTGAYSFAKFQSINMGLALAKNTEFGNTNTGFNLSAGYHGGFFNTLLQTSLTGNFISANYYFYNEGGHLTLIHNSSYRLKKRYYLRLNNSFIQMPNVEPGGNNLIFYTQDNFNNLLSVSRALDLHSTISLGAFFNIFRDEFYRYTGDSRGIQFTLGYTLPEENLIFSSSTQAGFNQIVSAPNFPNDFFLNTFALLKYRVYSLMVRFTNGNPSAQYFVNYNSNLYSEDFAVSLNHQYQFRNRHFILNNMISYNYLPALSSNSFGITPELNFYTDNRWRIRLTGGFYFSEAAPVNLNPYSVLLPASETSADYSNAPIISSSLLLMLGLHKDFGIPLPFIKRRFPSLHFIAFIDINGNGKFDIDETRLENVVINVDGLEVMTNDKGEAQLNNMSEGEYPWQAFSLDDVHGFFPNISEKIKVLAPPADSLKSKTFNEHKMILVPYVKGIKLFGRVYADREKLSPDALSQLDLSGIRISVNCEGKKSTALTDKDGSFSFYLPYGNYIVSMDEKILGTRFRTLENDIEVQLNKGIENVFVSFYIAENQRKISRKRFDSNGNLINEESEGGTAGTNGASATTNPNAGKDLVAEANAAAAKVNPKPRNDVAKDAFLADKIDATTTKGLIYTVQLGAFMKPLNPGVFTGFKNMMYERIDNNMVRITVGNIASVAEAMSERDNLAKVGFPGCFVSVYYDGKNISLAEAAQIKSNKK